MKSSLVVRALGLGVVLATQIAVLPQTAGAQNVAQNLEQRIEACRITTGTYAGGYKLNPAAAGTDWFFTALALRSVDQDSAWAGRIEAFLDLYLRQSDPVNGWIDNIDWQTGQRTLTDSDDSYCSEPALLAAEYAATPPGKKWWVKHGQQIKARMQLVLLDNQVASGLVTGMSKRRKFPDPKDYPEVKDDIWPYKIAAQQNCYLMDCCETYASLNAVASVLETANDQDAPKFRQAATKVAAGIATLYDEQGEAFHILDTDRPLYPNFYPLKDIKFYPHRTAQTCLEQFQVPLGDAQTTKSRYDDAWRYFNAGGDRWDIGQADVQQNYPWMGLGYVATLRGDTVRARRQLDFYLKHLAEHPTDYGYQDIHEVGFALLIQRQLDAMQ